MSYIRDGGKIGGIYNSEGNELLEYLEERFLRISGLYPDLLTHFQGMIHLKITVAIKEALGFASFKNYWLIHKKILRQSLSYLPERPYTIHDDVRICLPKSVYL